jgi:phospholipid/cholesterol/gamma-HCH transport system substrate-binding protein
MAKDSKRYEKVSSVFVGGALFVTLAFLVVVAMTKGWFEAKTEYVTVLDSGEGVRPGSTVRMVGIHIGTVTSMELDNQNHIRTHLRILRKFQDRIRADSHIVLERPFLVGDKVLHITPGSADAKVLTEGAEIASQDSPGVMDLLAGKQWGPYFQTLEQAASEMRKLVDLLMKEKGTEKLVSSLSGLPSLIKGLTVAAGEVSTVSRQMSEGDRLSHLVGNLSVLSEEFKKVMPALATIAPELPKSSQRMVQALDEAVVTMKAMQRSYFLRSQTREIREEEAQLKEEQRIPASSDAKKAKPE